MIRDRGRIKWTSMMLPEHVKMLREWEKEDENEKQKELDEQQLEQMNETILEAMELNQSVAVTYYRKQKYECIIGKIDYWDQLANKLRLVDRFADLHSIEMSQIADVRVMAEY